MNCPPTIGAPTRSDLHRLREARRSARATVAEAEAQCALERLSAFRRELVDTIRVASPVLMSLLEGEGLGIGDIVIGWCRRPAASRAW